MKNMMLLYEQGNGYYEKLRILQEKEGGGANLQIVMENEFSEKKPWLDAYNLLRSYAPDFAIALHDFLGYNIEVVNALDGRLIHAYCVSEYAGKKVYIDVRGITTNPELFYEEFEYATPEHALYYKDGVLYDEQNNVLKTVVFDDARDYMDKYDQQSNDPWDAIPFFEEHEQFYRLEKEEENNE